MELRTLMQVLTHLATSSQKFFIPSYQRGYRWTSSEIMQLLDDLISCTEEHYFLQLLAVREDQNSQKLRIIDGQQRLTTILLIYDCLDGGNRCSELIEYETRNNAGPNSLDGHFKQIAITTIQTWLQDKSVLEREAFAQKIEQCEFLFLTIEEERYEFDFFSRLNTWKIPATEAELVKCYFLSNDEPSVIERRAIRWNQMERQLSDNSFWGMIANNDKIGNDRMSVLLGYVEFETNADDPINNVAKFPLFDSYRNATILRDELWRRVDNVFSLLQQWYVERRTYHLVGWYFHRKGQVVPKVNISLVSDALAEARRLIGDGQWLNDPQLFFNYEKNIIYNYLLLANVAWCSECFGVNYDFYRHSLIDKWSIEHVHARNQQMLNELDFKELALNGGNPDELWQEYKRKESKDDANAFLQSHLMEEEYPKEDEDNTLGNLALLPFNSNSCLNNKLFNGKRREILSWALTKEASTYWAPALTVAMFVKEVGEPADKFRPYWSKGDRLAYANMLSLLVNDFLNTFCGSMRNVHDSI